MTGIDASRGSARPTALIVLGGGEGRRLGGVSKPDLLLGGRRLLDRVLDAGSECAPRVVVAPETVEVPSGVLRTLEDPPAGGPVAGIAAGLALLRGVEAEGDGSGGGSGDGAERGAVAGDVLIVACDLPGAAGFIGPLRAARRDQEETRAAEASGAGATDTAGADGVIAAHADGRRELLAVLADRRALEASIREGGDRDRSVRSLLAPLDLVSVTVPETSMEDVDTWGQHAAWEERTS
ncbi:NTP transferase domain-containing protein [Brachybacterium halotolerans subsp. kimchii]|uniref:molybdenum cofactor guanylyltransferase n=1 Tax=Brachybacterium halotolerans TaxID=2795215 RepID=UPI001E33CC6A|nr:NTP transferase domain-containing protein [Brachybacterium halotolerans]UEJ82960.1 NTP transferase domain-containing protein [Brachybacterium halotolerans subsp. kimchii]